MFKYDGWKLNEKIKTKCLAYRRRRNLSLETWLAGNSITQIFHAIFEVYPSSKTH